MEISVRVSRVATKVVKQTFERIVNSKEFFQKYTKQVFLSILAKIRLSKNARNSVFSKTGFEFGQKLDLSRIFAKFCGHLGPNSHIISL